MVRKADIIRTFWSIDSQMEHSQIDAVLDNCKNKGGKFSLLKTRRWLEYVWIATRMSEDSNLRATRLREEAQKTNFGLRWNEKKTI